MTESERGLTVRDIVLELRDDVKDIATTLNAKADRADLRELENRVTSLEATRSASIALSTWQRWFVGTVCVGLVGCVIALVAIVLGGHG